jgi:cell division protein FtsI (penicillin-binding protein 3)
VSTNKRKDVIWRVYVAFFGIVLFGVAVLGKTLQTQIAEGPHWKSMADSLTIFSKTIEPERGNIYSEDGRMLATSLPYFDVRIDLAANGIDKEVFMSSIDSLSLCLSNLFGDKTPSQYRSELMMGRKDKNRYYLLKSNLSYTQLKALKSFPLFRLGRNKSGLIVIQKNKRIMPFGDLAERTIGYVGATGDYKVGIEGSFDEELNGTEGQVLVQRLAGGTLVPVNSDDDIDPQAGHDIYTTLDINLQDVAENALYKALVSHAADWGTCIVMEVKTGKIKAMANLTKNGDGTYSEKFNYALGERTEPGSTFKLASMIALLEDGLININDSVDIEYGEKTYGKQVMRDAEEHGLKRVSIKHAFAISSNVGVSKMVYNNYRGKETKFYKHLCDLRLTKMTGLEIKGEPSPKIKEPAQYSGVSLPWISVGYEQQITPLQMLCFYNLIANNGVAVKPYIVSELKEFNKTVKSFVPVVEQEKIVSEKSMPFIKQLLEAVCTEGTGKELSKDAPYKIAGKTGTTKLLVDGKYEGGYNASFIGYFPADNPAYSCAVMVSNPTVNGYYGGSVAGPVFREVADKVYAASGSIHPAVNQVKAADSLKKQTPLIVYGKNSEVEKIYQMLRIPFVSNAQSVWVKTNYTNDKIELSDDELADNKVPDVRGMGLKDAMFLLESKGLKVQVYGVGKVNNQSITPGTALQKGNVIILTLS